MAQRDPFIGKSLGQYRIERVIGRGGMATVYEATQTTVNRTVAVKVLPQTLLHDETFMQRFRREAEVAAQLEHFHILPVYDYGETENVPYIVMRYIEGGALEDLIKREGALPWDDIVRIINQVASALDYAHGRGIVHRDIKPSNIMLDNDGNAYLADFGIARIVEGSGTLTGSAVIGTPKYMSPDQSNPGPPAPAMDIYSLGVTVFEMITGELPFNADTPIALVMMHLTQPVPSLREKGFDVPPAVDAVVNRAMAKNPEERFASAGAMAQALERAVRGEPWEADSGMTSPMGSPAQTLPGIDAVADPTVSRGAAPADPDSGVPGRRERRGSPVVFGLIGTVIVIALLAAGFFFLRGDGANGEAAALSATQTADAAAAIAAEEEPTETRLPTQTATATVQSTETPTATVGPTNTQEATPTPTETPEPTPLPANIFLRGVQMLLVREGSFLMGRNLGRPNERPEHEIFLSDFYIDETEVTNESYQACVTEGGCPEPAFVNTPTQVAYFTSEFYKDYPLVYATWNEAQNYCEWRGGHLPTEAQWEKAARHDPSTGESLLFPWGSTIDAFYANFFPTRGETTEVRTYPEGRSPYGVYDMSGNAAEWVFDWYQDNYYEVSPTENPTGPTEGQFKVYRGGSYDRQGNDLTTTSRNFANPATQDAEIGFRCAFTPSGPPTE